MLKLSKINRKGERLNATNQGEIKRRKGGKRVKLREVNRKEARLNTMNQGDLKKEEKMKD